MLKYASNESDSAADDHTGERNVTLQDDIARVSVRTMSDIRPASEALRDMVERNAPTFRIAITDNICSKRPMVDDEGNTLSSEVFGFVSDEERQWSEHRVALSSPLLRACRYESEPFWCNEEGARTSFPNKYLDALSFADFKKSYRPPVMVYSCAACEAGESRVVGEFSVDEFTNSGGRIRLSEWLALR